MTLSLSLPNKVSTGGMVLIHSHSSPSSDKRSRTVVERLSNLPWQCGKLGRGLEDVASLSKAGLKGS